MSTLKRLIVRFARLLLVLCGEALHDLDPALIASALDVVQHTDGSPHTAAYKAVIALKALMKRHPTVRRRDLRLAIELAVRQVKP